MLLHGIRRCIQLLFYM